MKILVYYPKTQKTTVIECEQIEIGVGGLTWMSRSSIGFINFDAENYKVSVVCK